jgi:predicted PolB exonuclease-like 3'-5' exonuclease
MSRVLVFDIETIPDLEGGRRVHGLEGLDDKDTASALFTLRRQENGTEFLRLPLQKVVAISVVLRDLDGSLKVWSLGTEDSGEKELIERFFDGIERFTPQLVSWNGGGFDLPVLHYRALLHGISAPRYWETGEQDTSFRYDNYLSRYHQRHLDLMDLLALYNSRAVAPLDQVATLLGFPGKMGMSGAKVFDAVQEGKLAAVRDYCETDVLNTYLVYLRFQLLRGRLDKPGYDQETRQLREYLAQQQDRPHLQQFLKAWQ